MLVYERIDASEIIDFDKADKSKECIICHCWFFKEKNFNFEKLVCNGCHNILMFYGLENIAIFN